MENIENQNVSLSLTKPMYLLAKASKAKTILTDSEAEMCI